MSDISVMSSTQKIIVDAASRSVAVINAGPPGPNTGIPGPPGVIQSVVAGPGILVNASAPSNPIVSVKTTSWVSVPKVGTWVDETLYPVQYRIVGDVVEVRGSLKVGAAPQALTFPAGARPPANMRLPVVHFLGTTSAYGAGGGILNAATGVLELYGPVSHASSFVILSGLRWSITP